MNTQAVAELTTQKASALLEAYRMGKFVNAEDAILEGMKVGLELAKEADLTIEEQFMKDQMASASNIN